MPNQRASLPWYLDTLGVITTSPIKVHHFEFIDYQVTTDVCELQNAAGRIVWRAQGKSDFSPVLSFEVGWLDSLTLASLGGGLGKILVYIE